MGSWDRQNFESTAVTAAGLSGFDVSTRPATAQPEELQDFFRSGDVRWHLDNDLGNYR